MAAKGRPRDEAARERIVSAATDLFLRHGYVATTVSAVAEQAQVAVKTIYAAYDNKLGMLRAAHDRAVLGNGTQLPLIKHPWVQSLSKAESAQAAWDDAVGQLAESTARVAPILTVVHHAAADPGVAALLDELRRQRHTFSLGLAQILADLPGADGGAVGRVADVIYATMTVESYALFVTERRWTLGQWREWARETVARELCSS